MTNHWVDIKNANLIVVMGGNAAEAHPVGFRWAMEAKIHNGAKLIVIDPRFTRTASVADFYTPIRSGTDITFLSGVLLSLMNNEKYNREYTEAYINASRSDERRVGNECSFRRYVYHLETVHNFHIVG